MIIIYYLTNQKNKTIKVANFNGLLPAQLGGVNTTVPRCNRLVIYFIVWVNPNPLSFFKFFR